MKHIYYLAPMSAQAGLTTIALGFLRSLDRRGLRAGFFKPIGQHSGTEKSVHFARRTTAAKPSLPVPKSVAMKLVSEGRSDDLMAMVMAKFHESSAGSGIMVVEGLVATPDDAFAVSLNGNLIRTLGAEVIFVGNPGSGGESLRAQMDLAVRTCVDGQRGRVAGCILNRLPIPPDQDEQERIRNFRAEYALLGPDLPELIGVVPENAALAQCRMLDVARHLDARVIWPGEIDSRRVHGIHLLARTVPNMMHTFRAGNVLVTPADRDDVFLASCMAALNGIPLAGVVLTGDTVLDERVLSLCAPARASGLPVLRVGSNSYETATRLNAMPQEIPADDHRRMEAAMDFVSDHVDAAWIEERGKTEREVRLSAAAFCFQLTERARAANRRIVLPEGSEPRTIRAAAICASRGIARCVLLGDPVEIRRVAAAQGVDLPADLEILDAAQLREAYVHPMVELRKHKGLSVQAARDQLEDNVVLGTMMLAVGAVDGLVSGAVHSSANTVRPALQLIKTRPGVGSVSSVFFMCLPDAVVVYGDCAVVQDPDARTLAEIAVLSAESAERFGIPPRVALLSYSTGSSGSGADVDKVREATVLARSMRPDLPIDGPLQYDAAAIADVAAIKAPESPVAGRATVFVFPDLNTGNTTYKAVQRSANVLSIGPMLQGLRRPVNDLSRGALVEDIVYTIALTAVQASDAI